MLLSVSRSEMAATASASSAKRFRIHRLQGRRSPLTFLQALRQGKTISTANMFSLCAYETADHLIQRKRFFDPAQKVGLTTVIDVIRPQDFRRSAIIFKVSARY